MKHDVLIATEKELRRIVRLDLETVEIVESAFAALAKGDVVMPPILSMELPQANGEVDVKTAFISGFDGFAIKVSPGFFDNPKLGLPSLNGLMILFSARTGLVEAMFLDNGYLTDIRTAAAGAVAARHLAPEKITVAGVIGAGVQARLQIAAARLVREFDRVLVWGRDAEKAAICAREISTSLGLEAISVVDRSELVRQCQLVITTTPSTQPLIDADWLHPGLHVTAMGSDQKGKNEISPHAILRADNYICDRLSQCELLGEFRTVMEQGLWDRPPPVELGTVVAGRARGRQSEEDITICDLTGTGAQDTAIATHAFAVATRENAGTSFAT